MKFAIVLTYCALAISTGVVCDHCMTDNIIRKEYAVTFNRTTVRLRTKRTNPYEWSKDYLREIEADKFDAFRADHIIDSRIANQIRAQEVYRIADVNVNTFDHDSEQVRQEYKAYTSGQEVDHELCNKHLHQMVELLDELEAINKNRRRKRGEKNATISRRHIHLARVLDSFGRYESGVLSGRSRMPGSTRQCLETQLLLGAAPQQVVDTRVCSAKLKIDDYVDADLKSATGPELSKYQASIEVAICLPKTCHSGSLERSRKLIQRLVDSQFEMPESMYVDKHREIEDLFCLNEGIDLAKLPASGKVLLALIVVWVVGIAYVTYNSQVLEKSQSRMVRLLSSHMDLKRLVVQLVGTEDERPDTARVDFDALNFVRIFTMSLIVLVHSFLQGLSRLDDFNRGLAMVTKNWFIFWISCLSIQVDTFFVISGMLFTAILMKRLKKISIGDSTVGLIGTCLKVSAFRYLRLVPFYFLVYWFKRSVWIYLSTGLLTDKGFNRSTSNGACKQESWLTPILGLASYLPLRAQCLPQAWSISCDLFSSLLIPFLIIGLQQRPKMLTSVASAITLACVLSMYNAVYNLDPSMLNILEDFRGDFLVVSSKRSDLYTNAHFRLGSIMIGVVSGYVLSQYQTGEIEEWPQWYKSHATKLALSTTAIINIGQILVPSMHLYLFPYLPHLRNQLYPHSFVALRFIWALACAIIFSRITTDWKDSFPIRLVNGNSMRVLAKLNYVTLLIHLDILYFVFETAYSRIEYSLMCALTVGFATLVYSSILGVIIHLVFESPVSGIIKATFEGDLKKSKPKQA